VPGPSPTSSPSGRRLRPSVRLRAAEVLAEIGRREGIPTILEQVWDAKPQKQVAFLRALDALNGVRQPALYASLREKTYKGRGVGRRGNSLNASRFKWGLSSRSALRKEAEWKDSGSIGFGAALIEQTLESHLLSHAGNHVRVHPGERSHPTGRPDRSACFLESVVGPDQEGWKVNNDGGAKDSNP